LDVRRLVRYLGAAVRAPSRIAWTAIGLAAMILVVASFGVTTVALRSGSSSSDGLPAPGSTASQAAADQAPFRDAAGNLSHADALEYQTKILGALGLSMQMTRDGEGVGTLDMVDFKADVMVVDHKTYLRLPTGAGSSLSSLGGASPGQQVIENRWISGTPDNLLKPAIDQMKTPDQIIKIINDGFAPGGPGIAAPVLTQTEVNGVPALRAVIGDDVLYVTAAAPHHLLRLEEGAAGTSSGAGGGALPTPPLTGLPPIPSVPGGLGSSDGINLGELGADLVDELYKALIDQTGQLTDAVDSRVQLTINGDLTFGACSASGCTVNASVRNTVTATAGQVQQAAISAEMTVSLTGDGSPAGSCTAKSLLTPGAETTMSCTVVDPGLAAYFRRVDTVAGQHLLNANGEVYAHAVATVEVGQIVSRLQRDAQTVRCARPGASADPTC